MKSATLILFIALLSLATVRLSTAATVEGIVLTSMGPVDKPRVSAFADYAALTRNQPTLVSEPGEKAGQYKMEVLPGTYFFTATGEKEGQQFFSYHGINPIVIKEEYRWLPFFTVPQRPVACTSDQEVTGIGGRVRYKGEPLTGGAVSVYSLQNVQFRGMGLFTNTLDKEGYFWFDLAPGSYVVIARHRKNDTEMGPLRKGDFFCYAAANPVTIESGQSCEMAIDCYPRDAIGDFLDPTVQDPRGRRETQRRMASLYKKTMRDAEGVPDAGQTKPAIIAGKVTDLEGKALSGLYISAYPTDNFPLFQMHVVRLITPFISQTDQEGRYQIEVPVGGYYLVAREKMGEAPDRPERYGLYEGNVNHSVEAAPGRTINDADIVVAPIMP